MLVTEGPDLMLLEQTRHTASKLYEAIANCFNCKSSLIHRANLRLEPPPKGRGKTSERDIHFRVLFVLDSVSYSGDLHAHWKWQEADIRSSHTKPSSTREQSYGICPALGHMTLGGQGVPLGPSPGSGESLNFSTPYCK